MENKVIVIGQPPSSMVELAKAKGVDLIVAEVTEEVSMLIKPEPMIITAPPIIERHFEDYKTGQERRRERRAKKRRGF